MSSVLKLLHVICTYEIFAFILLKPVFFKWSFVTFLIYSLYKKKRKHYIIFNNLRTFEDEPFKLTGDLDWHVPYHLDDFHIFPAL